MATSIYIPRSQVAPPQLEEGVTRLTLDEMPANGMPIRILQNGQALSQADERISIDPQQPKTINIIGDYADHSFEVDYYIASLIDLEQPTPYTVDLPEIELYSLGTTPATTPNDDLGGFDLLLNSVGYSAYDLAYNGNDLQTDRMLKSAVTLSVYTDAWVDGQRGWWGDTYQGDRPVANCKLWTLMGAKATPENRLKSEQYIKSAVQWLIDDQHLDSIDITTEHQANSLDWLAFKLICKRDGQADVSLNLNMEQRS